MTVHPYCDGVTWSSDPSEYLSITINMLSAGQSLGHNSAWGLGSAFTSVGHDFRRALPQDRRVLPVPSRYQAPVAIQLVDATLEEALNAIVEQVPGLGWVVPETRVQVPTSDGRTASRLACNLAQFDGSSSGVTTWMLVLRQG